MSRAMAGPLARLVSCFRPSPRHLLSAPGLASCPLLQPPASHHLASCRPLHLGLRTRMPVPGYSVEERGATNTASYRLYIKDSTGPVSPFHDVPLRAGPATFHAVVEIPRWTNAKMEVDTRSPLHPIVQDQKKGKLRFVANSFPHHGYMWNYGCLPQTWEKPGHTDPATGCGGDNDPVDVCEIGGRVARRGEVLEVKVLGVLAMVDDGETDWKVIVIDVDDPLAASLNNMDDVDREMPGFKEATREWFRVYKMADGKPENVFGLDGVFQDPAFAVKIIEETHEFWRKLVGLGEPREEPGELCVTCVAVEGAGEVMGRQGAAAILTSTPPFAEGPEVESGVDKWHYVHLKK